MLGGTLSAGPAEAGEFPALTYRAVATAYPRTARRSPDPLSALKVRAPKFRAPRRA